MRVDENGQQISVQLFPIAVRLKNTIWLTSPLGSGCCQEQPICRFPHQSLFKYYALK
jgi:hypothetical protein